MNENTTSSSSYPFGLFREKKDRLQMLKSPSEKTLNFLKTFARNYRASSLLPESLSGFVLS